jgi:hypothetical protein
LGLRNVPVIELISFTSPCFRQSSWAWRRGTYYWPTSSSTTFQCSNFTDIWTTTWMYFEDFKQWDCRHHTKLSFDISFEDLKTLDHRHQIIWNAIYAWCAGSHGRRFNSDLFEFIHLKLLDMSQGLEWV